MGYLSSIFLTFCSTINMQVSSPAFVPACLDASKAAAMQTGVGTYVDGFVQREQNLYQPQVLEKTGTTPWIVASGAYMVYQKHLEVSTSLRPIAQTLRIEISNTSQTINLSWSF
jgi:hypothetical protein